MWGKWELPPLARGRANAPWVSAVNTGITPARAGKRGLGTRKLPYPRNYPRSRGEESPFLEASLAYSELPPLARGRGFIQAMRFAVSGITPARAGKRGTSASFPDNKRNYPRSRGEECLGLRSRRPIRELPPLARGRGRLTQSLKDIPGITPARAGKRPPDLVVYRRRTRESQWNRVPNLRISGRYAGALSATTTLVPTS